MSWEKTAKRKKCQIFASAMYSSYQVGVSPEGGLAIEVGQTLWFFEKPFARKLIYFGAKLRLTIYILKSNTRQEIFPTSARHIKCAFLHVREESGSPVGLFKDEFSPQRKWNVLHLDLVYLRDVNLSYRPHQNEITRMKRNTLGRFSFYSAVSLFLHNV